MENILIVSTGSKKFQAKKGKNQGAQEKNINNNHCFKDGVFTPVNGTKVILNINVSFSSISLSS